MEDCYSLLTLVLEQHYRERSHVLQLAKELVQHYNVTRTPNYEKILGTLYQMLNDLPPDILLYYLTTVPFPDDQPVVSSTLIDLMKQMLSPSYHNSMKSILLKHLNQQRLPSLKPIIQEAKPKKSTPSSPPVKSVIDANIELEKQRIRKRPGTTKHNYQKKKRRGRQIKSLTTLCALNVHENQSKYLSTCRRRRKDAWNLVNDIKDGGDNNDLLKCYNVIRDMNKKVCWLNALQSGQVPFCILYEEYGRSDVFYKIKHLDDIVGEDLLDLSPELQNGVDEFIQKCLS